jgi:hypothetical protein
MVGGDKGTAVGRVVDMPAEDMAAAVALRLDAEVHTGGLDFGRFRGVCFRNLLA